uniref:Retrovirus-related Pol polyprotein from transposon TNT 1-94 n=1 Tax=Tanacetum cinerariifolium TaxID=118510 RepID=A0A6L2MDB2_TANCI|nr:retrovirus-related Pol polyprotein from transposon TNT 1-94 [Tanacetum cinerariifolium]
MAMINDLKALLKSKFEMKDLGTTKKILGMEIWRDRKVGRLWVSQEKFMANPSKAYWKAVKWILRYLKGGLNICLVYDGKGHGDGLVGYADSDYGADMALLKSKFEMKDLGTTKKILGMEIWHDRKAGRLWVSQEKYIKKVLQPFFVNQSKLVNTPLAANFKLDRSTILGTDKEVKYMKTVPYSCAIGSLMYVMKITTEHNPADTLMKALPTEKFEQCLNLVNIRMSHHPSHDTTNTTSPPTPPSHPTTSGSLHHPRTRQPKGGGCSTVHGSSKGGSVWIRATTSIKACLFLEMKRMQNVPYVLAVGSIMYAVRYIRPNVAFTQNITSRFQQNSSEAHWTAMKNILKYLRNTKDTFLVYSGDPEVELRFNCYCDVGFETDRDDMKSQTGSKATFSRNAKLDRKSVNLLNGNP